MQEGALHLPGHTTCRILIRKVFVLYPLPNITRREDWTQCQRQKKSNMAARGWNRRLLLAQRNSAKITCDQASLTFFCRCGKVRVPSRRDKKYKGRLIAGYCKEKAISKAKSMKIKYVARCSRCREDSLLNPIRRMMCGNIFIHPGEVLEIARTPRRQRSTGDLQLLTMSSGLVIMDCCYGARRRRM